MPIRWHQLEGFYHVARSGNYTKAAQAFPYPIGQPAVYQQVKGLQKDLGITLVRQSGSKRTELTPEGRALYSFLAPFFEQLPNVVEQLQGAAGEPLRLATDQFLAMEALPGALARATKKFTGFQLRVEELGSGEIPSRVASGEADAGLMTTPGAPPGLVFLPMGRVGVSLLVPQKHALAKLGRAPTQAETAKHALIVYEPHSSNRALTERMFRESGQTLKIAAEVTFSQTMKSFVRSGIGPAFVPYLIHAGKEKEEVPEPPREPGTVSFDCSRWLRGGALPYGLLYRAGIFESRMFQALVAGLKEEAGLA